MKNLKVILPSLAFVFAIVAAYASITPSILADDAKGFDELSVCTLSELNNNRTIGTSTNQCFTQDDGNPVCTVTIDAVVTAYHPTATGGCTQSSNILYIQD